jgi:hypothetical protein
LNLPVGVSLAALMTGTFALIAAALYTYLQSFFYQRTFFEIICGALRLAFQCGN